MTHRRPVLWLLALALAACAAPEPVWKPIEGTGDTASPCDLNPAFGHFPERLEVVEVEGSDAAFWLQSDYVFVDRDGQRWVAPASAKTHDWAWNGSSIPHGLALFLGTPFVGCHRRASVLHDYHYQTAAERGVSRKQVDRLFHGGLRANGVGRVAAKAMYYGVRLGGGRHWRSQSGLEDDPPWPASALSADEELELILAVERYVEEHDPTLDELDALDPHGATLAAYAGG